MKTALTEAERLDKKYPTIKPYSGQFSGYGNVDTSKLRRFCSDGFIAVLDRICVNNCPATSLSNEPRELIDLFLASLNLYDKEDKRVVACSRSNSITSVIIDILPVRRSDFEDSLQVLLFNHNDKRVGVIADLIRHVGRNKSIKKDNQITTSTELSQRLIKIFYHLLTQYILYDFGGNIVSIKSVEFIGENNRIRLPESDDSPDLATLIENFLRDLGQYIDEEAGGYGIKLSSPRIFCSKIGKLQKAVTPWTFGCNASCLFCYTDWELGTVLYPPGWNRPMKEIQYIIEYYDSQNKTGLPQSIFPMADWEPMKHPKFVDIIKLMAIKSPGETIFIVTNGEFLTEDLAKKLKQISQVHLQISLNSSNPSIRQKVMRSYRAEKGINALILCKKYGIPFDVSIVATPQWTGWKDIYESILFVDSLGTCDYIRLALPTATKNHQPDLLIPDKELIEIKKFVELIKKEVRTPIIVTVALVGENSLDAKVEGVLKGSVADVGGVRAGDVIYRVGNIVVRSRTEANDELQKVRDIGNKTLKLTILRQGVQKNIDIDITEGREVGIIGRGSKELGVFGILLPDDVDFTIFNKINNIVKASNYKRPVILTSPVMKPFFTMSLEKLKPDEEIKNLNIIAVKNNYFGGNVNIAGLQVVDDQIVALGKVIAQKEYQPDAIFVSAASYSKAGDDLRGDCYKKMETHFGIPVYIIKANTGSY